MCPRARSWRAATVRKFRNPWALLPIVAVNSLLWRGSSGNIGDGTFRFLSSFELFSRMFRWVGGSNAIDATTIGIGFGWLLFLALTYLTIPLVLPTRSSESGVFDTHALRTLMVLIVAGFSYQFAVIVSRGLLFATQRLTPLFVVGFTAVGWTITGLLIYARWWRKSEISRRIDHIESFSLGTIGATGQAQLYDILTRTDWVRPATAFVLLGRSSAFVLGICLCYGVVASVGVWLFPLPEFIVLAGTIASISGITSSKGLWQQATQSLREGSDFLGRWIRSTAGYTTSSWKGASAVGLLSLGLLFSTALLLLSGFGLFSFLWVVGQSVARPSLLRMLPIRVWNVLGITLCLVIPGAYSQWFWLSVTARLPRFLTAREGGDSDEDTSRRNPPRLIRRPRYNVAPPTVLWLPIVVSISLIGETDGLTLGNPVFAVGWPLLVLGVLWMVHWTRRREPLPARTDGKAMQAAFLLQLAWLYGLHLLIPNTVPFALDIAVSLAVMTLLLYNLPDLGQYFR